MLAGIQDRDAIMLYPMVCGREMTYAFAIELLAVLILFKARVVSL